MCGQLSISVQPFKLGFCFLACVFWLVYLQLAHVYYSGFPLMISTRFFVRSVCLRLVSDFLYAQTPKYFLIVIHREQWLFLLPLPQS